MFVILLSSGDTLTGGAPSDQTLPAHCRLPVLASRHETRRECPSSSPLPPPPPLPSLPLRHSRCQCIESSGLARYARCHAVLGSTHRVCEANELLRASNGVAFPVVPCRSLSFPVVSCRFLSFPDVPCCCRRRRHRRRSLCYRVVC